MKNRKRLIDELVQLIPESSLEDAKKYTKSQERVDAVQGLLRQAIKDSSLGILNGQIYYYGGVVYEVMEYEAFGDLIYEVFKKLKMPYGDYGRIESVIKVCRRKLSTKKLEIAKGIAVFKNCVLNTRTREVYKFSKKYVQTSQLDYEYDAEARGYLWQLFLDQVLPSKVYQQILQEYIGSLFIPRKEAKMETLMILYGNGSNGKSVVFETVLGILGKDNVTNFGIEELIGKGQERKRNIATINGKRLNYCSETRGITIDGDSGTLKALISGEPIEARHMYGENFTVDELPQIMINANKLPDLKDWTYGMKRRICILPFDVEIPVNQQNRELAKQLKEEYSAIFNWVLDGRDRFVKNGYRLTESLELQKLMDDYEAECNSAIKFMHQQGYDKAFAHVEDATPCWISSHALYVEYRKWAWVNYEPLDKPTIFGRRLTDAGYKKRRRSGGMEYAIYGEKALKRLQAENLKLATQQKRNEFYNQIKNNKHISENVRNKLEEELGCMIACGDVELSQYLGQERDSDLSYHLVQSGKLEGSYTMYNKTRIYNLDIIDKIIVPDLEENARIKQERAMAEKKKKIRMQDYELNEII